MANKKVKFWQSDWFFGLAVSIVFLFASGSALLQSLERAVYDWGVRASSHAPGDRVAVIAIDDQSIGNLGRWPWPRDIHATMVQMLAEAQAKVIGLTVFYSEPQQDPGLTYIQELQKFYAERLAGRTNSDLQALGRRLDEAEADLDTDQKLADSLQAAGNVVLSMQFEPGEPLGNPDQPLPDYVTKNALNNINDGIGAADLGWFPYPTKSAFEPIERLGSQSWGIGHLLTPLDVDGAVRIDRLVLRYYDLYFPSQSLLIAAKSLNLGPDDIQVNLGEGVQLGKLNIATDGYLQMRTFFYGDQDGRPAFPVDSFYDVLTGKIPAEKYKDKIVLIGATAFGVGAPQVTPVAEAMEPVLIMAHSVASILNENFFVEPGWGFWLEILLFLLIAGYLIAVLPRLKAGLAAAVSAGLFAILLATEVGLLVSQSLWLKLVLPATLLFIGHLLLTTKRFLVTERGKIKSDTESAESNKMLGLAFQQQGQLDMAFEKFRKHPLDDDIMEPLYNLALDYERKRQFAKATSVYDYMAKHDGKFRDLDERRKRAKAMEETVMFGGASGSGPGASLIVGGDGSIQKPMLGRYEVEKELGKGAMGIVYLGKDPKINRVVAIKTMALSQEFEADELEEVKSRFFREAETAGRLDHPNIVTIYDAGEEHDLAYIAMEFLEGHDLVPYTKPDNLLPVSRVMGIVYKCALALDFAHKQNVVHRDVKPANVMYEPKSKKIKITDFGIARITDSSKTKTGMVLGTPSYMSPEQLAGKKIDGRSDLFSLGVMLYQMVSGRLPFRGDSMATLMYKIANEPHQSVLDLVPELKTKRPCLAEIIDKALEKDIDKRYQTGAEMARDLHACAKASSG